MSVILTVRDKKRQNEIWTPSQKIRNVIKITAKTQGVFLVKTTNMIIPMNRIFGVFSVKFNYPKEDLTDPRNKLMVEKKGQGL